MPDQINAKNSAARIAYLRFLGRMKNLSMYVDLNNNKRAYSGLVVTWRAGDCPSIIVIKAACERGNDALAIGVRNIDF